MIVTIESLRKNYYTLRGRVDAIRNIDLQINDGELFVLLGPSGCGKSTLLNLLAGLEKPTGGEIRFDNKIMASDRKKTFVPPGSRDVAMVFQSYALYPHMTVEQNIAFPLKIAGISEKHIRESVMRFSDLLGIREILKRRPAELSGGQRQRVAIARAIVRRPALFLLDEPLSNLDAQLRTNTRVEIKRLQRELGVTTLYVTHDQTEAMTLGDRIALFKDGRIIQVATPTELYEKPVNTFAARFIGTFPMNFLKGRIIEENSHSRYFHDENFTTGFRPEHTRISEPGKGLIDGKIVAQESLGRETLIHVETNHGIIMALESGGSVDHPPGERVSILPDSKRLYLFEAKETYGD